MRIAPAKINDGDFIVGGRMHPGPRGPGLSNGRLSNIVHQYDAIPCLAGAQAFQRDIHLRHREGLGDRRDGMPRAELQHFVDHDGTTSW